MMKSVLCAAAGLSIAGVATAAPISGDFNLLDPSQYTLTATPLDGADSTRGELDPSFYSAIDGPYNAFSPATGDIGFDDYSSIAEDDIILTSFRFVGGVAEDDGTMSFQFFNADEELVDSFGVTLPAGNFIWTITLNSEVIIPANGIIQASVGEGFTGQWFLGATLPTIGTNDNTFGGANGGELSHRFELNGVLVPTPGAVALLGMAGFAATRRRR
jgi:hypothetical protein